MNLIEIGAILIAAAILLRFGFRRVPPMHYAMINIFGKRWRVVSEGLVFLVPGMESMDLFSIELQREDIKVMVKSKDLLGVQISGSVEYVLDPKLLIKYQETARERAQALVNSVKTELGIIAGSKEGRDFVHEREPIMFLINCILRLKELPHDKPGLVDETLAKPIPPEKRLDFYEKHRVKIRQMLIEERQKPQERSKIEEMYGIDIQVFDLDLDYSRETNAAFEKEQQDKARAEAARFKKELIDHFRGQGASFQEANDAAELALGQVKDKKVVSLQGKPISISFGGGNG